MRKFFIAWAVLALTKASAAFSGVAESCPFPESAPEPRPVKRTIIDITAPLSAATVAMDSQTGLGEFRYLMNAIDDGDFFNGSGLKDLTAHAGTHVDSPGHFINEAYHAGKGVHQLDLAVLNGPALVLEVPDDTNITAAAMEQLAIPPGTERVIFKTLNTKKRLMSQTAFEPSYTAVTKDGAEWIVANTGIRLIGIDYLSVAHYADLIGPHIAILSNELIPVEGLLLEGVEPGLYMLNCLPLKLVDADGAPARCILTQ